MKVVGGKGALERQVGAVKQAGVAYRWQSGEVVSLQGVLGVSETLSYDALFPTGPFEEASAGRHSTTEAMLESSSRQGKAATVS